MLQLLTILTGAADKALGNREGWAEFNVKPLERGVATHIYASFDPDLEGMLRTNKMKWREIAN